MRGRVRGWFGFIDADGNVHIHGSSHTHRYDACVGKCADTHVALVKGMEEKLAAECKKRL